MSQETQIDYEKIVHNLPYEKDAQCVYSTSELYDAMRESATEAIRLAAPLFAEEAGIFSRYPRDEYGLVDTTGHIITEVNKASIIDAVEKITKQVTGE